MYQSVPAPSILLAAGGPNPRVDEVDVASCASSTLFVREAWDSIYALGVSLDGRAIAAGTRGGGVHVLPRSGHAHSVEPRPFKQGAPVLSVCFLNDGELASSDTEGRCLLWQTHPTSGEPRFMICGGGAVCSLVRCPDTLVGVSDAGEILAWRRPFIQAPFVTKGVPPLPAFAGLVQGAYWPAANAAVFPTRDGSLALYELEQDQLRVVPAHDGELYAIAVMGNALVTVGRMDGLLRTWSSSGLECQYAAEAPRGTVAAAALPGAHRVVLVNKAGSAGVFGLAGNELVPHGRLPGNDYRVAVGPSPGCEAAFEEGKRAGEAREIAQALHVSLQNNRLDGAVTQLARLDALGYQHVSLSFTKSMAGLSGDLENELRASASLAGMLPDTEHSVESLCGYADVLQRAWQFEEALEVIGRVLSIGQANHAVHVMERIREYATVLAGGECLILPAAETPLDVLIRSATVLGRPFRSRWVLRSLGTLGCHGVAIPPSGFIAKFGQLGAENPGQAWPALRLSNMALASPERLSTPEATAVFSDRCHGVSGLELALRFHENAVDTVVEPMVIFNAAGIGEAPSAEEHNTLCLAALETITTGPASKSWLQTVHRNAEQALGRLVSETLR